MGLQQQRKIEIIPGGMPVPLPLFPNTHHTNWAVIQAGSPRREDADCRLNKDTLLKGVGSYMKLVSCQLH